VEIVFTTGIYTPRTPSPQFFAGIPIWVKYFFEIFFGDRTHNPHPPCRACYATTALRLPSLVPPCHINQNPEVAGETDRQLAKNVPIDMDQTAKQVPNTPPPWGGGHPYSSKWVSNQGGPNSQSSLAYCVTVRAHCNAARRQGSQLEEIRHV
jgi:hypothetical protein